MLDPAPWPVSSSANPMTTSRSPRPSSAVRHEPVAFVGGDVDHIAHRRRIVEPGDIGRPAGRPHSLRAQRIPVSSRASIRPMTRRRPLFLVAYLVVVLVDALERASSRGLRAPPARRPFSTYAVRAPPFSSAFWRWRHSAELAAAPTKPGGLHTIPGVTPPQLTIVHPAQGVAPGFIFVGEKGQGTSRAALVIADNRTHRVVPRCRNARVTDFAPRRTSGQSSPAAGTHQPGRRRHSEYLVYDDTYHQIAKLKPAHGLNGDLHEFQLTPAELATSASPRGCRSIGHVGRRPEEGVRL